MEFNQLDLFDMDLPPDVTLLTGPVGCGKTEAAIDAILDVRLFGSAFSTIWVLLATDQQIHAFRQRMLARSPDAVQFGVEFFNFHTLYQRLLDLASDPQRHVEGTARFQIMRHVALSARDRGELELFGPIADLPGFAGLVSGLIYELKQGLVFPERFTEAAQSRGPKDRDLARLYAAYQDFLRDRRLVDRHGAGWLALEHLQNGEPLARHVDLLVVDGFDQFNQVHIRLLNALAAQVKQTVLTLTTASEGPGRRFRRFEHTRQKLLVSDDALWREQAIAPGGVPDESRRPAALAHLVESIFRSQPDAVPAHGVVSLIEAPDVAREVQAVLRRVKRLLLDGASPESVAIVARQMNTYGDTLRETARAYGIPLVVRASLPLPENPAVAALLSLIDLAAQDFPRRELLDTLRSPYLIAPDLTPEQAAQLERISLARQVVRGRETWLSAVAGAAIAWRDDEGDADPLLDAAQSESLHAALKRFFDRITPPERGTLADRVRWIEAIIGPDPEAFAYDSADSGADEGSGTDDMGGSEREHFAVLDCVRAGEDGERVTRDVMAMKGLFRVLGGLQAADDLLSDGRDPGAVKWHDFRALLDLAVGRASVDPPGGLSRLGRVLATDALEVRGLPHDHVFILGLSEGGFPVPEPEDALYQSGERQSLIAQGIDLQAAGEMADDMSLFYQAIGLARRSLVISRFTVDDKGTPCPPSPYWNAVRAAVAVPDETIERVAVGAAPTLDAAATLSEAAIALAAALSGENGSEGALDAAGVHNALLDHAIWRRRWLGVLRGRELETRREDVSRPFDRSGGVLGDPALVERIAASLGPGRVWSASQLTEYGICPFRFFARRLLRLEELKEPEEGMDVMQLGLIHHAILEQTYRRIGEEGLAIAPENQERALAILDEEASEVFATAPKTYGFRPSPVWDYECDEMRLRLRRLVGLDFSDATPFRLQDGDRPSAHPVAAMIGNAERRPLYQEARFGAARGSFTLDGPAGPVRVRGVIDRVDVIDDSFVVVVDYKTGATKHPVEDMAEGRDFQMMLYLLAADALLSGSDWTVGGGLFWHLGNRTFSGEVLAGDEAVTQAQAYVHAHIAAARSGWFAVQPRKLDRGHCVSYCEFGTLCRMTRANLRKPGRVSGENTEL